MYNAHIFSIAYIYKKTMDKKNSIIGRFARGFFKQGEVSSTPCFKKCHHGNITSQEAIHQTLDFNCLPLHRNFAEFRFRYDYFWV